MAYNAPFRDPDYLIFWLVLRGAGQVHPCTNGVNLILSPSRTETFHGLNRVHIGARARALENQMYIGVSPVIGNASWSQAVDINNGFAALYGPPDNGFLEDGIVTKGILNDPTLLITEIDFYKVENVRKNGQVFNFKYNSEYPWVNIRAGLLKIKTTNLV